MYVFKKYRFLLKNTGLWASKYRFVFPEVGMSVYASRPNTCWLFRQKPCLDGILPSSVSNLRGDYHNPLPAKLVHTRKINLRQLVICWKTRW